MSTVNKADHPIDTSELEPLPKGPPVKHSRLYGTGRRYWRRDVAITVALAIIVVIGALLLRR